MYNVSFPIGHWRKKNILPADPYCLCYRLKRMRDLLESGINISSMRQKWWRMCLVGKLEKVYIILGDGCPQQVVSCVLISGDVISAISIRNCAASCMFITFWYFCPVSKINLYLEHLWLLCQILKQQCILNLSFMLAIALISDVCQYINAHSWHCKLWLFFSVSWGKNKYRTQKERSGEIFNSF